MRSCSESLLTRSVFCAALCLLGYKSVGRPSAQEIELSFAKIEMRVDFNFCE
jgi:hypothetical protein